MRARSSAAKRLDMIVANLVGAKLGFDEDENSALVLWDGGQRSTGRIAKTDLARQIVALVAERLSAARLRVTPIRRPWRPGCQPMRDKIQLESWTRAWAGLSAAGLRHRGSAGIDLRACLDGADGHPDRPN